MTINNKVKTFISFICNFKLDSYLQKLPTGYVLCITTDFKEIEQMYLKRTRKNDLDFYDWI